jgi:hypothetical protein
LTSFQGTFPDFPAGAIAFPSSSLHGHQEQHLTLDVHRNLPPSLLEALNGLERNSEEFCYLFLRLFKLVARGVEFLIVHVSPFFGEEQVIDKYTTLWYIFQ